VALWMHWWSVTWQLRPACARLRSFLWFATCVAGMTVRTERLGVTSTIRALGLQQPCYDRLLDAFASAGEILPQSAGEVLPLLTRARKAIPVEASGEQEEARARSGNSEPLRTEPQGVAETKTTSFS